MVRSAEPGALNLGYYGMPERTDEAWRGGWFHTGDAFRQDDEGNFYFVDRMNDAIRRRGENISSFEVEAAVAQHPAVRECAAVGVRTEFGDDEVMAVVIAGDPAFSRAALLTFLEGPAAEVHAAAIRERGRDLPRNATTGRVRKSELRAAGVTAGTWDAAANQAN